MPCIWRHCLRRPHMDAPATGRRDRVPKASIDVHLEAARDSLTMSPRTASSRFAWRTGQLHRAIAKTL